MTETPKYFDKVLAVAEIARLEATLDFERQAKEQAQTQVVHLAQALKDHSKRTLKALNFDVAKIPVLVQSIRPWLAKDNAEAFEQVIADPGFESALKLGVKALIAETLSE